METPLENDEAVCYVCLEPTTCCDICDCTVGLHPDCQLQLMRRTNTAKCGVCRTDFRNAKVTRRKVLRWDRSWFGLILFITVVSMGEIGLFAFLCERQFMNCGIAIGFMILFGGIATFLTVAIRGHWGALVWLEDRISVQLADTTTVVEPSVEPTEEDHRL